MLRLILSELASRYGRALALGVAVLAASVAFVLLSSAARSGELRVKGSVSSNFRAAYDVLVRPRGSSTQLEKSRGLVRDNYLSGIFGGITLKQWRTIERIPGVSVAAPIANIGYVLPEAYVPVKIDGDLTSAPEQLFRLRFSYVTTAGSRYPAGDEYVYYTRDGAFARASNPFAFSGQKRGGQLIPVCAGAGIGTPSGPFDLSQFFAVSCFSARTPSVQLNQGVGNGVGVLEGARFPIFVAAIDPDEEARLLHLNRTVVSGRYLREGERPVVRTSKPTVELPGPTPVAQRYVPVIASTKTFVGESLDVQVERLKLPAGVDVPRALAAGACLSPARISGRCPRVAKPPPGDGHGTAAGFLRSLTGTVVASQAVGFGSIYERLLAGIVGKGRVDADSFWTVGGVSYRVLAPNRLAPRTVTNPPSVYSSTLEQVGAGGFLPTPADNRDIQFRKLQEKVGNNFFDPQTHVLDTPRLRVVGRYDPTKLPGFSKLSKVPLETYYPPQLQAANAATRRVLHGQPLEPTQNLGDYVQQPPLMLTTIDSLSALLNSEHFSGVSARERRAPISSIRVRVAGVTGPNARSQARIASVALRIHEATGLDVDITAGSSPHPLTIDLPAGRFGRPALTLSEGWSKKGASLAFLRGVDRKRLALFALIPLICCLFLANGSYAAAEGRRGEIGTMLTLGWPRRSIFTVLLGEVLIVGLFAGLLGIGIAAALVAALSLGASWLALPLVLPTAVGLALVAGLVPALRASAGRPLDALRPRVVEGRGAGGGLTSLGKLALLNLRRVPVRAFVGALGLAAGSCALTILIAIEWAFQGVLAGTLLGDAISVQIRGLDYFAVALVIGLAMLSIGDVLYLSLRERQAELVTLRTLGWKPRHIGRVVMVEALMLGLAGSLVGAAFGAVVGLAVLAAPAAPVLIGAAAATAGGVAASLCASALPLSQIGRLTPPSVLGAEQ